MRIAVIGAGSIGRRHFDNLTELGAEAVLLPWRSYRPDALDGAHAAVIATATDVRLGPIGDAVERGLPVYVEKPLAFRPDDLEALLGLMKPVAERSMLGLMMRYHPAFRTLAQMDLSDIHGFSFEIGHDVTQWRQGWVFSDSYAAKPQGGGVLLDLCHEVDMAACLFPDLTVGDVASVGHADYPGVDMASRVPLTNGAAAGSVAMDYLTPALHRRATLHGHRQMLEFDFANSAYSRTTTNKTERFDRPLARNEMFLSITRDWLALLEGKPVSDVEHLPRLDHVAASARLLVEAWQARRFTGHTRKELP